VKNGEREKINSPPPLRVHRDRQQRALRDYRRQRRLFAHLQRRGRKQIDNSDQPRRTEVAQRGFGVRLSRKMQPRKSAIEQGRYRRSLGHREAGLVQPGGMALRGGNDHARIGAGDYGLGEFGFDHVRLSGKRTVDNRIDLEFGCVGDHRHHILERDLALSVGVEREFFQLIARGLAVAAEQCHQRGARVRRDTQIRNPQFAVDQSRELARVVGIAADRDRGLGAFAGLAQRRFRPQLAGLDHDAAILQR